MYGVPAKLDLTFLHEAELIQICFGQWDLQFHFAPEGSISVWGEWELRAADESLLDRSLDEAASSRPPYQLHRLLGRRVTGSEVHAPGWVALHFEGGEVLKLYDSFESYESFMIQPGGIVV